MKCRGQQTREALAPRHEERFREGYLKPAIEAAMVEMTLPGKPQGRLQRHRPAKRNHVKIALAAQLRGRARKAKGPSRDGPGA
jgi:hypothetical protein